MNLRAIAASIIKKVIEGHSLTEVLPSVLKKYSSPSLMEPSSNILKKCSNPSLMEPSSNILKKCSSPSLMEPSSNILKKCSNPSLMEPSSNILKKCSNPSLMEASSNVLKKYPNPALMEPLSNVLKKSLSLRDLSLIQAMVYGVCRWFYRLENIASHLLTKPLKEKDRDIYCLLLVGLYQLIDMRIPEHACVAETVAAASQFKKKWASSLVNAVLRHFIRRREELIKKANQNLIALYSYPEWIITQLKLEWPLDWQTVLMEGNKHPPFSLRVNQRHMTRDAYLLKLSEETGAVIASENQSRIQSEKISAVISSKNQSRIQSEKISAVIIPDTQSGIQLSMPLDVTQLPGFAQGEVSVQDGAAQLAAELLELSPHQRVLDACAAPGGKTAHILEIEPSIELVALDVDPKRLQIVRENLTRLTLSAHCVAADAADLHGFWDGKQFDRILLDAPCSATGVIRRHPDIKLLRRASDIAKLAETQGRLLEALWTTLMPGGLLLYTTCSIFPEENVRVMQRFLATHSNVTEEKIIAAWGKECTIGRQILPGMHGMDGFYFARLRKCKAWANTTLLTVEGKTCV
jgi:16S rRNA (cytosine967-C5)-methyltransferase